jgi:histidyl-tRNA synthetase
MGILTTVRGFKDILPGETGKWQHVEETARNILIAFSFREIRLPLLEKTELFRRGIGAATDIVEKEMYTFLDRDKEYLTLRPEATASVIRAYVEHNMHAADPMAKLFTIGPMFRRERPQKGRFRQFHQINAEVIGIPDPRIDAEVIFTLMQIITRLSLPAVRLEINSLGCPACRPSFRAAILEYVKGKEAALCGDCRRRLQTNPLRIFDCKIEECRKIVADGPQSLDYLCPECSSHFDMVRDCLGALQVPCEINPAMVRGLDYYTKTAFEITTGSAVSQNAIAGGGRYDGLVKELGGPDIPGIGFAIGCERLIDLMPAKDEDFSAVPVLFLASLGKDAERVAYILCNRLRQQGIMTETDYGGRGLKSQMKRADKLGCRFTLFLGERELAEGRASLRDMRQGTQKTLNLVHIEETLITMVKEAR